MKLSFCIFREDNKLGLSVEVKYQIIDMHSTIMSACPQTPTLHYCTDSLYKAISKISQNNELQSRETLTLSLSTTLIVHI